MLNIFKAWSSMVRCWAVTQTRTSQKVLFFKIEMRGASLITSGRVPKARRIFFFRGLMSEVELTLINSFPFLFSALCGASLAFLYLYLFIIYMVVIRWIICLYHITTTDLVLRSYKWTYKVKEQKLQRPLHL